MELAPGSHIDRFVVEARVRSSLLATVYQLVHRGSGAAYALKILHIDRPSVRDRILHEGRGQARLHHPNVVAIAEVLDVDGSPGLLMDFVSGPPLSRVIGTGQLDLAIVKQIVPGILAGVAAAHQAGIIHRDLKPANILLDVCGDRIVPKITDFGLARLIGDHRPGLAGSGAVLTTPSYMSPEQVRDARIADERSDIFALGAILYELVTGHRAFDNDNVFGILSDISGGNWVPVRDLSPEVPDGMVEAIGAALEVEPEDRVADCEELFSIWAGRGAEDLQTVASWPVVVSSERMERLLAILPERLASVSRSAAVEIEVPLPRFPAVVMTVLMGLVLIAIGVMIGARVGQSPRFAVADRTASVRVVGDAARVRLVGWRGEEPELSDVPPGIYRVEADHGTGEWIDAGRLLQLDEGDEVVVFCRAGSRICRW